MGIVIATVSLEILNNCTLRVTRLKMVVIEFLSAYVELPALS